MVLGCSDRPEEASSDGTVALLHGTGRNTNPVVEASAPTATASFLALPAEDDALYSENAAAPAPSRGGVLGRTEGRQEFPAADLTATVFGDEETNEVVERAEDGIHEAAPFVVVGLGEGEDDGNM
jgi:hypothetical protein